MSEIKDPAIKLFGKTIPLLSGSQIPAESGEKYDQECQIPVESDNLEACREASKERTDSLAEEPTKPGLTLSTSENHPKAPNMENKSMEDSKPEAGDKLQTDTDSEDKILKKPDKIVACPRCNSLETKFCYYNNYNVNQPRHFCKNCQRYWTAGGTMRNVPIGAGRRKNKHATSQYRQLLMTPQDPTVLKFGPGTPLCESMATVLNIGEQKRTVDVVGNATSGENRDEPSPCGSSVTATSTSRETGLPENMSPMEQGAIPGFYPCYPGPQWIYPQSIPFACGPPSYWAWAAGAWNMPWVSSNGSLSPSSCTSNSGCLGNGSPTLGKHCREANLLGEEKSEKPEKCLWVPKTLRINDPNEAAKSSIWATLGIKPIDQSEPIAKGGIFKAFQRKPEVGQDVDSVQVLQANPAAFSRSQSFQEST
ncbi:hypothetical protein GIB67_037734 [Kingdonia uniflora]|uniref:Dof-type domain-containing protein n=1 Tax=Kingdonia uniflora TaxID=39325 RepID=A0A7J7LV33_9MAGN|nr:hypothetical protein GIB67_037734 [Kingdonia uniflora]